MNETFSLAADPKLSRVRAELESYARNSIRIHLEQAHDIDNLPIGVSKLGGRPDLPVGHEWPSYIRTSDRDSRTPFYIPFLGQFSMSELAPYDLDNILPRTGFIYFFYIYDYDQFEYIPCPGRLRLEMLNGIKVLYHDVPISQLERMEYPPALLIEEARAISNEEREAPFTYKACSLKFSTEGLLPSEEIQSIMTEDEYRYWSKLHYDRRANHPLHQMLGYPDMYTHFPIIPPDLFREVTRSAYACQELRLLLQLDRSLMDAIIFRAWRRGAYFSCVTGN